MDNTQKRDLDNHIEGVFDELPLSLEESNQARLQSLQAIGVGVNGVNEALLMRMMEALLGPVLTQQVKQAHQEWLSETLAGLEEQVAMMQAQQAEAQRKAALLRRG